MDTKAKMDDEGIKSKKNGSCLGIRAKRINFASQRTRKSQSDDAGRVAQSEEPQRRCRGGGYGQGAGTLQGAWSILAFEYMRDTLLAMASLGGMKT